MFLKKVLEEHVRMKKLSTWKLLICEYEGAEQFKPEDCIESATLAK